MLTLLAVGGALLYLAWYAKERVKESAVRRKIAIDTCAREGHIIERTFAFDDPRHPVDNCTRCPFQTPVRYPCPHCGKELGKWEKEN